MNRAYFILYANCIPVKGVARSIIYDLTREKFDFITNDLFLILTEYVKKSVDEIKAIYNFQFNDIIDEYFDFLVNNEYIYLCEREFIESFPPMDISWDNPSTISNAIIDMKLNSRVIDKGLISQLEHLGCNHIQIRIFKEDGICHIQPSDILSFLNLFDDARIHTLELIIPFYSKDETFFPSLAKYLKLNRIIVYESPFEQVIDFNADLNRQLFYVKQTIPSAKSCGVVETYHFAINIPHYTESLSHNSCLNRKISIDEHGDIKNCPSMQESFGNIQHVTLSEAISKDGFRKYWNITKDQIDTCKECEFRHISYVEYPENERSKPLKCGYNPYTCEWEEWSTHPMKQKAKAYYKL